MALLVRFYWHDLSDATGILQRFCWHYFTVVCKKDKKLILEIIENEKDILKRNNKKYHFTVSTWIVSPNRKKF